MRIAYVAHVNGGRSGVFHKIAGQIAEWRARGHEVRALVATREDVTPWTAELADVACHRYGGPASRLQAMTGLVRDARAFRPDVVYVRWDMFYPPMLWFPRRAALAAEVNSDDLREYALGSRTRARYNSTTRRFLLGRARALVFVTDELSAGPSFHAFRGLHRVVTNGIRLSEYPQLPAPANERPRLAFVGTAGQPWHGIDKLVRLSALRPDWQFDLVGMGPDTLGPDVAEAPANVTWHGPLEREAVLAVLARADVGVGTLALHRKSMSEACSLKVREYLAVGLPVMYGYRDPDADALGPYSLRISNTETNVEDNLAEIDSFVAASRGVRVPRAAIGHIDMACKEAERLALFEELAGR
jgi:glycosyltransferase involved in cell wall biosynthesis